MAKVQGFEVAFTHRGSWKADLLAPGKTPEVIPVAWQSDYSAKDHILFIWFKKQEEIDRLINDNSRFRVAVARKNKDGSTSSQNIVAIFWARPIDKSGPPRQGLFCSIESRASPADAE